MSGEEPAKKKRGGRRPRPAPNAEADSHWIEQPQSDPVQEAARLFARNLRDAIEQRYPGHSGRSVAGQLGVDHNSLRRVLAGDTYPDLVFIVKAEGALNRRLWPSRKK
jgi:ribosome-binding protein aMBF1 (putative translation factor)